MEKTLLGGLSATAFMRRHWQKEARLVRGAMPGFSGILDRKSLFALASRDDVASRIVLREATRGKGAWSLREGPFRPADFRALPPTNWTLLVQSVDRHVEAAAQLLRRFSFAPYARLDDLMISHAVPGGGVGPHFDSYDVFLLQGTGRRRWRIGRQPDLSLQPGLPLKILRRFTADDDWVLDPGDMLYLPPSVAHDGVAVTECTTYSIGFRAPAAQELVERFLQYLPDVLPTNVSRYSDPDLRATATPGRIDARLQRRMATMLDGIRWDRALVARFLGCTLSEPAADVYFDAPDTPAPLAQFAKDVARSGCALDRRSRMLYDKSAVYLNGECVAELAAHPALASLADERRLPPSKVLPRATLRVLHDAYLSGALHARQARNA